MKKIIIEDCVDIDYLHIRSNLGKTIFWVGSGISIDSPSNLPSGYSLTKFYLKKSLPIVNEDFIINKWKNIYNIVSKVPEIDSICISELIRLEFIIGCIDDVDCEIGEKRLISCFNSFSKILPNKNHHLIKYIIDKYKSIIITPNFDLCIENCFDQRRYMHRTNWSIFNNGSYIFHYHGSAYSTFNLGATIRNIKKGFSDKFSNYLLSLLNNKYNIIFLGFSCSDYFDVTQFFKNMPKCKFDGELFFVSHNKNEVSYYEKKLSNIFQCFKKIKIIGGDTTYILNRLCDGYNINEQKLKSCQSYNWKSEFEKVKIDDIKASLYLIKILNRAGLGSEYIRLNNDNIQKAIKKYFPENIKYYLEKKFPDNKEQSIMNDIISTFGKENSKFIYQSYKNAKQKNQSSKESLKLSFNDMVNAIEESLSNNKKIYHIEVFAFIRYVKEISYNLYIGNLSIQDHKVYKIISISDKLLKQSPCSYQYITYYTSICRVIEILKSIINMRNSNYIIYAIEISMEICATYEIYKLIESLIIIKIIEFTLRKNIDYNLCKKLYECLNNICMESRHIEIITRHNTNSILIENIFNMIKLNDIDGVRCALSEIIKFKI